MLLFFLTSGLFLGWALGANDAANVFGTAVGSRMLSFRKAAVTGSIFVIIGAVAQGAGASDTLGKLGAIPALAAAFTVALAAALSVFWMTRMQLPVSTSQAIVGAIIGWNVYVDHPTDPRVVAKIVGTWISGPVLGALFAFLMFMAVKKWSRSVRMHLLYRDALVRLGLLIAGAFGAYSLGANNIANVMGVFVGAVHFPDIHIAGFVFHAKEQLFFIGGVAIAVGIISYSQKVMETVGRTVMPLSPDAALVVVLAQALVLFIFSSQSLSDAFVSFGLPPIPLVPVSSSQVVIGSIIGVGLYKGGRELKFGILGKIGAGWIATPLAAGVLSFFLLFFMDNVFKQDVGKKPLNSSALPLKNEVHLQTENSPRAADTVTFELNVPEKSGTKNDDSRFLWMSVVFIFVLLALSGWYFMLLKKLKKDCLKLRQDSEDENAEKIKFLKSELDKMRQSERILTKNLKYKQGEMVNLAMNIIRKNDFLEDLKQRIVRYKSVVTDTRTRDFLNKILVEVIQNMVSDYERKRFEMQLDEINSDFLRRLVEAHPDLTDSEKRLATLLRLNLSSKQIASVLHISPKSVEMSRYRLRKKLKIPQGKSLTDFLRNF